MPHIQSSPLSVIAATDINTANINTANIDTANINTANIDTANIDTARICVKLGKPTTAPSSCKKSQCEVHSATF